MGETYPDNNFTGKDIISIHDFTRGNIEYLIGKATQQKLQEKSKGRYASRHYGLPNKKAGLLFFENSTRTRTSHETAMIELGGKTFGFSGPEGTSLMKKENIFSTAMMYWAYHADTVVMRHKKDGSVQWAADVLGIPVINGGDGTNEHPTQALLDMLTIDELHTGIHNAVIGMGGDLKYGRTIRSLSLALSLFDNITINWAAEDSLAMPDDLVNILENKNMKVNRMDTIDEAINNSEIFYMTRPQVERIEGLGLEEIQTIMKEHQVTAKRIKGETKILHPLPVNKEIAEIDFSVFHHEGEYFFSQAENGVFLRKALLLEILENQTNYINFNPKINREIVESNNKELLPVKSTDENYRDNISNGMVIDHLKRYNGEKIFNELKLNYKGENIEVLPVYGKRSEKIDSNKDQIKIKRGSLTDREIKQIELINPGATFNIIEDGQVVEKFKYKLCSNTNCITREVAEDVPPRFEGDNCHYCRHEYNGK